MTIYVRTSHSQHEPRLILVIFQGLVPGGTGIVLNAPNGATQYVWTAASIPAGTSVLFVMSDAQNHTGGVSDILVSGSTGSNSCINANSPSVTPQATSPTQTSSPSSSATTSASKSNKISGITLVAAIAGSLVFVGVVAALGVFLLRRCRKKSSRRRSADFIVDGKAFEVVYLLSPRVDACTGYHDSPSFVPEHHGVEPFPTTTTNITPPYEMIRMENSAASLLRPTSEVISHPPAPSPLPTTSTSSRKIVMAPPRNQPAQFILHTDVEETEPDENGFIELPPQYSESRRPLVQYGSENGGQSSTQSSYIP